MATQSQHSATSLEAVAYMAEASPFLKCSMTTNSMSTAGKRHQVTTKRLRCSGFGTRQTTEVEENRRRFLAMNL